jgi:carbon-monoxide dehydrogenase medium subunit
MIHADYLVNIKHIPGLNEVTWDGRQVQIGATLTHNRLETNSLVHDHLPLLAEAESQIANIRVRNQGTLGGNLCFNDPHSDPGTVLLIYDTAVTLAKNMEIRQMPLSEFLAGTYATALTPGELLQKVAVTPLPKEWGVAYFRVHRYQRPTLNVAVAAKGQNGALEGVRLSIGCVGPIPRRLTEIESKIQGLSLKEAKQVIDESTKYLFDTLQPVDDLLGTADYKIYMARVLLNRALTKAAERKKRNKT